MDTRPNPLLKLALEAGPLVVFFLINGRAGIFWATGAFMVAISLSIAGTLLLERRVPILPLVTGIFVLVFGALTLLFSLAQLPVMQRYRLDKDRA